MCRRHWKTQNDLLVDSDLELIGHQANEAPLKRRLNFFKRFSSRFLYIIRMGSF
jgi:hypothetical protein